jgi:hypothetical protein
MSHGSADTLECLLPSIGGSVDKVALFGRHLQRLSARFARGEERRGEVERRPWGQGAGFAIRDVSRDIVITAV